MFRVNIRSHQFWVVVPYFYHSEQTINFIWLILGGLYVTLNLKFKMLKGIQCY